MAGGEGGGKEEKWHLFEAVVCVKATGTSIAVTEHMCSALWWLQSVVRASHISKRRWKENSCSLGTNRL